MQVNTLKTFAPVVRHNAAPTAPLAPPSIAKGGDAPSGDSVSLGKNWKGTALGDGLVNIGKGLAVTGGIPAIGALGASLGRLGVVGALAGTAALGAYLGSTIDLEDHTRLEKMAFGGSLAGLGCMIAATATQLGGVTDGLVFAGTMGAVGAFRGFLETLAQHDVL